MRNSMGLSDAPAGLGDCACARPIPKAGAAASPASTARRFSDTSSCLDFMSFSFVLVLDFNSRQVSRALDLASNGIA
jgi:hypothetical protein